MNENPDFRAPATDDYAYLCGVPSLDDFLSFARNNRTDNLPLDTRLLSQTWRKGNDAWKEVGEREADLAKQTQVQPLPEHLGALKEQVLSDPVVQGTFDLVPIDVGLVRLDQLSVYQKHLNLSYVHDLAALINPHLSEEDLFRYCLLDPPHPVIQSAKVASNGYVFVSPSNDLRFLGPALLEPSQVTGYPLPGRASGVIGLVAGFGANCLAVTAFDGRLILHNGTHRSAALWRAGFTHVPAVIQYVADMNEFEAVYDGKIFDRLENFFKMPRSPMFKDYFDPRLTYATKVPRRLTQIKVTFGYENIEIPVV
jgi:hypothetical protein